MAEAVREYPQPGPESWPALLELLLELRHNRLVKRRLVACAAGSFGNTATGLSFRPMKTIILFSLSHVFMFRAPIPGGA